MKELKVPWDPLLALGGARGLARALVHLDELGDDALALSGRGPGADGGTSRSGSTLHHGYGLVPLAALLVHLRGLPPVHESGHVALKVGGADHRGLVIRDAAANAH